jgi:hypothetical protein
MRGSRGIMRRLMGWRLWGKGAAVAAIALVVAHCASVSGLDKYAPCTSCREGGATLTPSSSGVVQPEPDDSSADAIEVDTGSGLLTDAPEWSDPDSPISELGPDPEPEAGQVESGVIDASHPGHDGGPPDAGSDAPMCNASSCSKGCCTDTGLCAGGGLTQACGAGGAACRNCANSSLVCSAGACVTPVADSGSSGPPQCAPSTCANLCVPYFIQCCKPDQSCGCALFYPPGMCN